MGETEERTLYNTVENLNILLGLAEIAQLIYVKPIIPQKLETVVCQNYVPKLSN